MTYIRSVYNTQMTGITDYVQHRVGWNQITEQTSTLYRNMENFTKI